MSDLDDQSDEVRRGKGGADSSRGASADDHGPPYDPRLTRILLSLVGVFGTLSLGIGSWMLITLIGVKDGLTTLNAQYAVQYPAILHRLDRNDARDDQQDRDLNSLARDLSQIDGRTQRSAEKGAMEARRER